HRGVVHGQDRNIDYVLVPESASVAVLAHEFMHLLGLEDKYDDEKASVADECIMGTGYSIVNPPPPCAECRIKLGWAAAATVDPAQSSALKLGPNPAEAIRIPLNPEGDESLLLEMRERLLVWHVGGGRKIELVGRFPTDVSDRLTPLSEPSFRGRSVGARQVWITDIRVQDGKAWFWVGPESPLTALEEWHRSHIGKVLKD
ncbi:MAG TPA: immune inhibitor A domain-containing protein, partial [Planctomycetota bacterium]|nr:immune inhibitor A domain-containing protein [Planctomycetota bacterium]